MALPEYEKETKGHRHQQRGKKYDEALYGEKLAFLASFLRQDGRAPSQQRLEFHILDSVDGEIQTRSFLAPPTATGPVSNVFLEMLQERPLGSRTRLVLVQGAPLVGTNPQYIDAVARELDLDPQFLDAHLYLWLRHTEAISLRDSLPVMLPSEREYLQIVRDEQSHMTAVMSRSEEGVTTGIVLGYDYDTTATRISDLYRAILQFSPEEVRAADECPADYLFPYVREAATRAALLCRSHVEFPVLRPSPFVVSVEESISRRWEKNQALHQALVLSLRSLAQYINLETTSACRLKVLLQDYETLIQETRQIGLDLQGLLQAYQSKQAIEVTKRGLQQADSVRRLTLVAFVFIPLNFASSVFGMNLEQLGTGSTSISWFFFVAVLGIFLATILAAGIKPSEDAWNRAKQQYAMQHLFPADQVDMPTSKVFRVWLTHQFSFMRSASDLWNSEAAAFRKGAGTRTDRGSAWWAGASSVVLLGRYFRSVVRISWSSLKQSVRRPLRGASDSEDRAWESGIVKRQDSTRAVWKA